MHNVTVNLFYLLKEKAGTGQIDFNMTDDATIRDLKQQLIKRYPGLQPYLDNIMVLINRKIALDEDRIPENAQVSFLTPIGGG